MHHAGMKGMRGKNPIEIQDYKRVLPLSNHSSPLLHHTSEPNMLTYSVRAQVALFKTTLNYTRDNGMERKGKEKK